jgi:hypothetical protein
MQILEIKTNTRPEDRIESTYHITTEIWHAYEDYQNLEYHYY